MVPSHRPVAARRACSPSGIRRDLQPDVTPDNAGRVGDKVVAGMNPATRRGWLVMSRKPFFVGVLRDLRMGPVWELLSPRLHIDVVGHCVVKLGLGT